MRLTLPRHALGRLSVSVAQGIALSLLYQAVQQKIWPATNGSVFALLVTVAFFVPTLVISGLGNLRPRTLIVWGAVATAICAGLAYYDILRLGLKVMDMTAVSLCKDNNMPMIIFNMNEPGNIVRVASGERVGSLVTNERRVLHPWR